MSDQKAYPYESPDEPKETAEVYSAADKPALTAPSSAIRRLVHSLLRRDVGTLQLLRHASHFVALHGFVL